MPHIAVEEVQIGDRLREEYGDIDGLAESLEKHGLIHPIVLDADNNLVCGGRRLAAAMLLGWEQIEYREVGALSEKERRLIELEENRRRKDLTPYEEAKNIVEQAETAREMAKEEAELRPESGRNSPKRGRPPEAGSDRDVEDRTGIPRAAVDIAEKVVETVETYPFMQNPGWKQTRVLEAREHLQKLPESDRPKAAALIGGPFIPPSRAVGILKNLVEKPADARAEIFRLQESEDSRERSLALTRAAELVPAPDPRSVTLREVSRKLKEMAALFTGDPFNPELTRYSEEVNALADHIRDAHRRKTGP